MAAAPSYGLARVDWQLVMMLALTLGLLVPVVILPGTFFPYVVPRNILFRASVEIAAAALVARIAFGRKRLDLRGEYVLPAFGGFLAAITISAIASPARSHSLNGDFERMGGVWAWIHLALFLLVLRSLDWRYFVWLLNAAVGISVYASAHFVVELLGGATGSTKGLSLVGNPGLFAGYLMVAAAVALYLASTIGRHRWLYIGAAVMDLGALILTQNRSSVAGLIAGTVVAGLLLLACDKGNRRWLPFGFVAGVAFMSAAFAAAVRAGSPGSPAVAAAGVVGRIANTDLAGRDAARAYQWDAALAGFLDRPVLGYGIENHHLAWSAHFDPRIYDLGTEVFDRTHNTLLEMLATTGIVGTAGFLAIWLAIGYSLHRAFAEGRVSARELALLAGANVAYAGYLFFWFVDINAAMPWILLIAIIAGRYRTGSMLRDRAGGSVRSTRVAVASVAAASLALVFLLHRHAYVPLRTSAALGTIDLYGGSPDSAFDAVRIVSASSAPQTSHTGPVLAQFIASLERRGQLEASADPARRLAIDRTFSAAITALEAELLRDPLNDRLHTSAAGALIEAARYYRSPAHLERAIALLRRANQLSPQRREARRLLDVAYARLLPIVN